jgi:hypothetical protein
MRQTPRFIYDSLISCKKNISESLLKYQKKHFYFNKLVGLVKFCLFLDSQG